MLLNKNNDFAYDIFINVCFAFKVVKILLIFKKSFNKVLKKISSCVIINLHGGILCLNI